MRRNMPNVKTNKPKNPNTLYFLNASAERKDIFKTPGRKKSNLKNRHMRRTEGKRKPGAGPGNCWLSFDLKPGKNIQRGRSQTELLKSKSFTVVLTIN